MNKEITDIEILEFPEIKYFYEFSDLFGNRPAQTEIDWITIKTMIQNKEKKYLEGYEDDVYISPETNHICNKMLSVIGADKVNEWVKEATDLCGDKSVIQNFKFLLIIRQCTYDNVFEIIGKLPYEKKYKNLVYAMIQYQVGRAVHDYEGD